MEQCLCEHVPVFLFFLVNMQVGGMKKLRYVMCKQRQRERRQVVDVLMNLNNERFKIFQKSAL